MKVWITKYALTRGVFEGDVVKSKIQGYVIYANYTTLSPDDWSINEATAKARAEEMRAKKIASLKKQLAKLEAMKF